MTLIFAAVVVLAVIAFVHRRDWKSFEEQNADDADRIIADIKARKRKTTLP